MATMNPLGFILILKARNVVPDAPSGSQQRYRSLDLALMLQGEKVANGHIAKCSLHNLYKALEFDRMGPLAKTFRLYICNDNIAPIYSDCSSGLQTLAWIKCNSAKPLRDIVRYEETTSSLILKT